MRLARIITSIALLASCGFAQEEAEAALARAFLLEEMKPEASAALAVYETVAADAGAAEVLRIRAELGRARCLRKEGKVAEALAVLDSMKVPEGQAALADELETERARLATAEQDKSGQQDPVEKRVIALMRNRADSDLADMGRQAVPILVRIIEGDLKGERTPFDHRVAIAALVRMQLPEIPETLIGILRRKKAILNRKADVLIVNIKNEAHKLVIPPCDLSNLSPCRPLLKPNA